MDDDADDLESSTVADCGLYREVLVEECMFVSGRRSADFTRCQ